MTIVHSLAGLLCLAFPTDDEIVWHDAVDLGLEGKAFADTRAPYDRLPASAEGVVRGPVWTLSRDSAGMLIRFRTDATTIWARWTLISDELELPHMPATGVSGLDLYAATDDGYRWVGYGRPVEFPTNSARLAHGMSPGDRDFLLYLPLYNGVSRVEIGLPGGSSIDASPPREATRARPIVFYGTSITQGGCASRPGATHVAILGRELNRPVVNLGFSGHGRLDLELAPMLAEIDAELYVIDCLPNLNADGVRDRIVPFVEALRARRPDVPVLLVEDRTFTNAWILPSRADAHARRRAALREGFERLRNDGHDHLFYLAGDDLLGEDGEGTVDGSHPTDLGFQRQAAAFRAALLPILDRS